MKIVGLIYLFTPVLAFTMGADTELERDIEVVSAAEKSSSGSSVKAQAKDPRTNSNRPRVTHREAPEQKADQYQVVQEDSLIENDSAEEDQTLGMGKPQQRVLLVPKENLVRASNDLQPHLQEQSQVAEPQAELQLSAEGNLVQEANDPQPHLQEQSQVAQPQAELQLSADENLVQESSDLQPHLQELPHVAQPQAELQQPARENRVQEPTDPKPQVQKRPQLAQPRPKSQVKPQVKPKQNSGASTSRPLNRNSVYQKAPVQEKAQGVTEGESKALSFKAEPNRVTLISRVKPAQLVAAERAVPAAMQRTVPLERKKVQIARENPAVGMKQRAIQPEQKSKTKNLTFRQVHHPKKSHATVYSSAS